ncbi:MAG: sensor histidine kinase [Burkholderiales bacterium]|nr:MAG: sensor histidine kinase [Burkholderiales bacterium]
MPRLGLAFFRRRLFFRAVFVLLIAATLGLALAVLQDEKERSYQSYQASFKKTQSEILARLRHPAGQLALLNPQHNSADTGSGLVPLLLPFGALDFDDPFKAQQAIESAGCAVQLQGGSSVCAAIGNNPYAGGFVYLAGSFNSAGLQGREKGQLDLQSIHRAKVSLSLRGNTTTWIAPLELQERDAVASNALVGRWAGFLEVDTENQGNQLIRESRPIREFRGWVWQSSTCADAANTQADCPRRAFFSIRLPAEALREAIWRKPQVVWPPADLNEIRVSMQVVSAAGRVFDSASPREAAPSGLADLSQSLLPGETLQLKRLSGRNQSAPPQVLRNQSETPEQISPWVRRIVSLLPVDTQVPPLKAVDTINTPVGSFEAMLTGDVRAVERSISIVATRMLWLVGAMLAAIALAWGLIEIGLIRRVTQLAKRAAAVSYNVNAPELENRLAAMDVSDLRGKDELGILAGGLSDLMQRVKDDISREHVRAQEERQMWHAVGHEIMSPLQSLMVLHGKDDDASHRYVQRMQQAVKVLYGQASPSEAIAKADVAAGALDLDAFLAEIAGNAHFAGIEQVVYERSAQMTTLMVKADEFALEDVVTHILSNAKRHRQPGTPIRISVTFDATQAMVKIHNIGEPIDAQLLPSIFDYGVSSNKTAADDSSHRGQGLFVVKSYMGKMGGTASAVNTEGGVAFLLGLNLA